ncbi:hypothetical protein ES703_115060 [subsurface metagenome]
MCLYIDIFSCIQKCFSKSPANRLSHFAVHRCKTTEEAVCPSECLIDKLINDDQVAGSDFLAERAYRTAAYQRMNAELFQGKNVGCKRDLARRKFMPFAVAIQECDLLLPDSADANGRARLAERRFDIVKFCIS